MALDPVSVVCRKGEAVHDDFYWHTPIKEMVPGEWADPRLGQNLTIAGAGDGSAKVGSASPTVSVSWRFRRDQRGAADCSWRNADLLGDSTPGESLRAQLNHLVASEDFRRASHR
jgi:hypothetical protein